MLVSDRKRRLLGASRVLWDGILEVGQAKLLRCRVATEAG